MRIIYSFLADGLLLLSHLVLVPLLVTGANLFRLARGNRDHGGEEEKVLAGTWSWRINDLFRRIPLRFSSPFSLRQSSDRLKIVH